MVHVHVHVCGDTHARMKLYYYYCIIIIIMLYAFFNHNTCCYRYHSPGKEVIVSESMSLTQFVERYAKDLPLQIKVLRGYCGSTARLTSKYICIVLWENLVPDSDCVHVHVCVWAKVPRMSNYTGPWCMHRRTCSRITVIVLSPSMYYM